MIFQGEVITVTKLDNGIAELQFDAKKESVNKFDHQTVLELAAGLDAIESDGTCKALLVTSGKPVFIVGADITEFGPAFNQGAEAIEALVTGTRDLFNRIEDFGLPSVAAINGYALGGGCELCLACDYRVMSTAAKIGLPETKLGILPGWGGTVRLPRLAGVDTAVEWIAGGAENRPAAALKAGVVDGVVAPEALRDAAIAVAERLMAGELDYKARRVQKTSPLDINDTESLLSFESSKAFVGGKAGRNYPAPVKAIKTMQEAAKLGRDEALKIETAAFCKLASNSVARALTGLFLSDQYIGKKAKAVAKKADLDVKKAAVLGAGIMGGGIAYQSALKKVPIKMKDINQAGLDLGLSEAAKLLTKRLSRGRLDASEMAATLNRIEPTLNYGNFDDIDIVVEAVVENPKVKKAVLAEVEKHLKPDAVLCSNTSTISIDLLAEDLAKPENFCGMHFFNPVHAMPLVEVIRGAKTSEATVAATVAYAQALGKKPVVVGDCPGFLVNRVLFPYFAGFAMLMRDGANFEQVDKVMERWGWPMGPAYLMDVVGIDTGVHAEEVMAAGFPDRLSKQFKACSDILFEAGRYGQKNDKGFYQYSKDKKGKPVKKADPEAVALLAPHCAEPKEFTDEEIVARLMVPMATELARCLDEGIVDSAAEADMALVYGLGFPPFRGGLLRWIDEIGIDAFAAMADSCKGLSPLYELPQSMQALLSKKSTFYPQI
ncbi:fatty acid oxidation complex subunit alpha FadB [Marinagarivorans algicola]|uniref:fatty acid oxidation complex subunit alpha FadB n=1 Tax=Marinagarivorans algicola TaxID=1513270 RepID=UPI0006B91CDE|nr:fatty acid oxidation complex subunit alpha FadB [Marinagarivorans algicola]